LNQNTSHNAQCQRLQSRLVLQDLFTTRGYQISEAEDGKEALKFLETEAPDLIISDYRMPEMDDIELFKATQSICPNTMRILLTAHGDLNVAMDAINQANVYKFVSKPWNNNDLMLTIH
jgi:response regulator RpfG family c-di-GMP phosphodiesterase